MLHGVACCRVNGHKCPQKLLTVCGFLDHGSSETNNRSVRHCCRRLLKETGGPHRGATVGPTVERATSFYQRALSVWVGCVAHVRDRQSSHLMGSARST